MKRYATCQVERTKLVTRYQFNALTSERSNKSTEEVTEPCSTPLFSEQEERSGICKSCIDGWSAEGNLPTANGMQTIKRELKRQRRNRDRRAKNRAMRDLGLVRVRGSLGGVYWE